MGDTTISWCHFTFNMWRGCTKATWTDASGKVRLHPGCLNCYAEKDMSVKFHGIRWGEGQERMHKADSGWAEPLAWARSAAKDGVRRRVFCASLADVLDSEVLDSMRERLWETLQKTAAPAFADPHLANWRTHGGLDWLLLTKRPENWRKVPEHLRPLVWLGTSISDQETANEWVPRLLEAQGFRYRFLSVEPMTGPVDLSAWIERIDHCGTCGAENTPQKKDACLTCGGSLISTWGQAEAARYRNGGRYSTPEGERDVAGDGGLDWCIVGGESGAKARPCNVEWVRSIVSQCREAGTACFVKQMGSAWAKENEAMTLDEDGTPTRDKKGEDWKNWPEDLRVREFPHGA